MGLTIRGSAPEPRFAFELASFIMLSPRGWLGSSAPEPRFAFWLASFSSYRRVNGLRAVPLNPSSRLSWRVSSCCRRVNGLGAVHMGSGSRLNWRVSSWCCRVNGLKAVPYTQTRVPVAGGLLKLSLRERFGRNSFLPILAPCVPPRCQRGGQPWEIAPSD